MSNDIIILDKLEAIERLLSQQNLLQKDILTLSEAAEYLDISESELYKKTSTGAITFHKPGGKNSILGAMIWTIGFYHTVNLRMKK